MQFPTVVSTFSVVNPQISVVKVAKVGEKINDMISSNSSLHAWAKLWYLRQIGQHSN